MTRIHPTAIVESGARLDDTVEVGPYAVIGAHVGPGSFGWAILKVKVSQTAAILPYLLLVLVLIFRPKGLLGTREG